MLSTNLIFNLPTALLALNKIKLSECKFKNDMTINCFHCIYFFINQICEVWIEKCPY